MKKSINTKLFLAFNLLILFVVGLILLLNITSFENFYVCKKETSLIKFFKEIDSMYISSNDSLSNLTSEFEKLETNRGIDIIIKSLDDSILYVISTDYSNNYISLRKTAWTSKSNFKVEQVAEEISGNMPYVIKKYNDKYIKSDFIVLVGRLKDNSFIYLRTPLESIRENIKISNSFLLIISMVLLLISSVLSYFVSRSFTRPIRDLNNITQKMCNLDFSSKYELKTSDELSMLGNSINSLSESLQTKIRELKEANIELEKDIEETSKISEMRSQFISDVSHELKTPIALIQGYAEGLADEVVQDEESKKYYIDVILDEANKMSELTRDLLDLTNLEYGKNELQFQDFDITSLISSILKKNELIFNEKHIKVMFDDSNTYTVNADMFRIEQVITNYLNNAIKNIGGDRIIKVSIERKEELIRVNIENTGENIDDEDLPRIWIRFFKTDNSRTRSAGGSGIGLSLVRAIMIQHGMDYGVYNTNRGVNFWFELKSLN